MLKKVILLLFVLRNFFPVFAQVNPDSTKKAENQELIIQTDSINMFDSIQKQHYLDSIAAREQFVRDSLLAREQFIKDSLARRKRMLDSVTFLKQNLPRLVDAIIKSESEEMIILTKPVRIIGDSSLSNFNYVILTQKCDKPYAPWRKAIVFSENSLKVKVDTINNKIIALRLFGKNYTFDYDDNKRVVRVNSRSTVTKKHNGYVYKNYYKVPIDSVFFDYKGRVVKIKKYTQYFEATKNYRRGTFLFTDLEMVKEFRYFSDGLLSGYKVLNYCGRWNGKEKNELCHTLTSTISRQGNKFTIVKKNEPENKFSDGTVIFEFDHNFDMKSITSINKAKSLNKKCIIELNEAGNVTRYLYEKDGKINRTLVINYHDEPGAKYKVETIVCFFEDDGISYYQKNTTTGKSRRRDKLTLEWSPWK